MSLRAFSTAASTRYHRLWKREGRRCVLSKKLKGRKFSHAYMVLPNGKLFLNFLGFFVDSTQVDNWTNWTKNHNIFLEVVNNNDVTLLRGSSNESLNDNKSW